MLRNTCQSDTPTVGLSVVYVPLVLPFSLSLRTKQWHSHLPGPISTPTHPPQLGHARTHRTPDSPPLTELGSCLPSFRPFRLVPYCFASPRFASLRLSSRHNQEAAEAAVGRPTKPPIAESTPPLI